MTWIVSTQLAGAAIPLLVLKSGVYNLDSAAIKPFSHNSPFLLRRIMVHLVLSIYLVFCVGQILLKYSEIVINLVKQSLADFLFMRWHAEHHVLVVFRFLTLQYMLILQVVLNSLIGLRIHFHI